MGIIMLILVIGLAVVFYQLIQKIFSITYFGFQGLATVFGMCLLIAYCIVEFVFIFVASHFGWIIAIGVVGFIIFAVIKSKRTNIA